MALYRLTLKEKVGASQEQRNVFHYMPPVGYVPGPTDWAGVADALGNAIKGCISSTANFYGWTAHLWLEDVLKWNLISEDAMDIDGTQAGETLPWQCACVVLGYTGLSKHIAKKWLGPCVESDQNGGVLVALAKTALDAFATTWENPVSVGGHAFTPYSWSKAAGPLAIVRCVADEILGTQRRRKPGRGI